MSELDEDERVVDLRDELREVRKAREFYLAALADPQGGVTGAARDAHEWLLSAVDGLIAKNQLWERGLTAANPMGESTMKCEGCGTRQSGEHAPWCKHAHAPPGDHDYICERCGKPITADTTVWLEMRQSTGRYVPETTVLPDDDNQGAFPFGADCAEHPNRLHPNTGRRK